jgi:hypothetical protein
MRHEQGVVYDRPQRNQPAAVFSGQGMLTLQPLQGETDAQTETRCFGAYDLHGRLPVATADFAIARKDYRESEKNSRTGASNSSHPAQRL